VIAVPAIDLRDGACVQLVGGRYDDERVRLPDPVAALRAFRDAGFGTFHVVDLDAATGRGDNRAAVARLLAEPGAALRVGGGVRDDDAVRRLVDAGAAEVVVGTRALEDHGWLERVAAAHPGVITVAVDVRGRDVLARGWQASTGRDVGSVARALAALPLAGLLVTAVHREGRLGGADVALVEEVRATSSLPIAASGGVTTLLDLRALRRAGASSAVIGMALYTGALDPRAAAKEFGR